MTFFPLDGIKKPPRIFSHTNIFVISTYLIYNIVQLWFAVVNLFKD